MMAEDPDCGINCPVVSADSSSRSQDSNQPPEGPPESLAMAIFNATRSIPSTSVASPVVIIRKPLPGPAPIVAQSGAAAPQAQLDALQMSSVTTDDCAASSAELAPGANHASIESDSPSLAYTSMISLPVANDQSGNEEAYVPAQVEAVVSPFFM